MHMYSTVTTNQFYLETDFISGKNVVTPPLALMTVCILFVIVEYWTFRSSVLKVYQIC